jgi:hypothetical protein
MQLDETEIRRCCAALRDYCWRKDRKEAAHEWHRRFAERTGLEEAAEKERNEVRLKDRFERHGLAPEALAALQADLKAVAGLKKAYFVRKRVQHMPQRVCYVLGYTVRGWLGRKRRIAEVHQRIHDGVRFPGETLFLSAEGENYRFGRKFRWMRGARIV